MPSIIDLLNNYFGAFEFGIRADRSDGSSYVRTLEASEKNTAFLRHRNAQGDDIFIRPVDHASFIFIDDLIENNLASHFTRPGRLIVESSPGSFQVWIHSKRPLSPEEKRHWQKSLGTDPGANSDIRWGRCPGFTNRKPKHRRDDGSYPMARIIKTTPGTAAVPAVPENELLFDQEPKPSKSTTGKSFSPRGAVIRAWSDFIDDDLSRTDMRYSIYLISQGLSNDEAAMKLRQDSQEIESRKRGHVEDYIRRTIAKARDYYEKNHQLTREEIVSKTPSLFD